MEKQELVELIKKWKSGDEDAYNIIYNEYHDRMLKIALSHTQVSGHSNMADAEDVVQDAMLKAYINIQSLDDPNKFEGWLTKIVVNKANDYMTSAMKKRNVLQTDYAKDDGEGNTLEFDAEDEKRERQPEVKLDAEVKQNIVQDILSGLSEDQRAVTLMYYYDEMSMKEIAEQLGIEMSTVVGRLQTAKKNIKNEVTAIQKRDDIKLYNLSAIPAIPFFMAMLGTARETAAVPVTVGAPTVAETLASEATQGGQSPASSVTQSTAETTKTPVENVPNNSANVAESPTSSVAEETVSNTAKATTKVAEEGAKATASSATTASASAIASTTAGASFATKLVVGIAVAAVATGGGIVLKNNLTYNNSQPVASVVEEPAAKEEHPDEKQDDQKADKENKAKPKRLEQEPSLTDMSNILSVDIPNGWTGMNETITTYSPSYGIEQTTYTYGIYSGDPGDKSKPFVLISFFDSALGGLGGDFGPMPDDISSIDGNTNKDGVKYSGKFAPHYEEFYRFYPFLSVDTDLKNESAYLFSFGNFNSDSNYGKENFQAIYFPMGDDSKLDDVKAICNSTSVKKDGTITLNVDNINIRKTPEVKDNNIIYNTGTNYTGVDFVVFDIEEAEGYTWYRIGQAMWIADSGQGWITYTAK